MDSSPFPSQELWVQVPIWVLAGSESHLRKNVILLEIPGKMKSFSECVLCVQRISLQSLMLRLLFQTHGQMGSCFFKVRWANAPMNCFDERNLRGNDIFRVHCLSAALIVTHPLSGKGALMLSSLSENDMAWTLSWSETGRSVRGKKTQLRCGSCSTILQQNLALFD